MITLFIIGGGTRLANLISALDKDKYTIFLFLDHTKDNSKILGENLYNSITFVSSFIDEFDILICCNTAKIIPQTIVSRARIGSLNLHSGPLPEYRGGSPLQWQYLNNVKSYGVSIVEVSKSVDSGKVYAEGYFNSDGSEAFEEIQQKANSTFMMLINEAIVNLIRDKPLRTVSSDEGKIWIQRSEIDSRIVKQDAQVDIFLRHVDLLQEPYPALCFITESQKKLEVREARRASFDIHANPLRLFYFRSNLYLRLFDGSVELTRYHVSETILKSGEYIVL